MDIAPLPLASHGRAKTAPDSSSDNKDEDVCHICRNPGDVDNPLRYSCACSGSIKFVHQDCLLRWLNINNARHCEDTNELYVFSVSVSLEMYERGLLIYCVGYNFHISLAWWSCTAALQTPLFVLSCVC